MRKHSVNYHVPKNYGVVEIIAAIEYTRISLCDFATVRLYEE